MGWSKGTDLMGITIRAAMKAIPYGSDRTEFYKTVIEGFEDADWDTPEECLGVDPKFDEAIKSMHPDWDWPEEEN